MFCVKLCDGRSLSEWAEARKREEREALKAEQKLREAKRQQQRFNFVTQQNGTLRLLCGKQAKSQPCEALPVGYKPNDQELLSSSSVEPGEEDAHPLNHVRLIFFA